MLRALLQNSLVSFQAVTWPLAVLSLPAPTLQPREQRRMPPGDTGLAGAAAPAKGELNPSGDPRAITPRHPQCSRRRRGASIQQHCVPTRCPHANPARPLDWNKLRVHKSALHKFFGWSWALPRFAFVGRSSASPRPPGAPQGRSVKQLAPFSTLCILIPPSRSIRACTSCLAWAAKPRLPPIGPPTRTRFQFHSKLLCWSGVSKVPPAARPRSSEALGTSRPCLGLDRAF